jgi:hypothetical protein
MSFLSNNTKIIQIRSLEASEIKIKKTSKNQKMAKTVRTCMLNKIVSREYFQKLFSPVDSDDIKLYHNIKQKILSHD